MTRIFRSPTVMFRASRQIEQERERSVIEATLSLANEKVARLDRMVIEQDNALVAEIDPGEPQLVSRRWLPTAARETPTHCATCPVLGNTGRKNAWCPAT